METEEQQHIKTKDGKTSKHRHSHLWTNSSYVFKSAAMAGTNKQDRDVKFSFAQNTFSTSDMSLETVGFHFSVVKKNHIRYKEHLKLIRKDNF